jgi:hypothetical protein
LPLNKHWDITCNAIYWQKSCTKWLISSPFLLLWQSQHKNANQSHQLVACKELSMGITVYADSYRFIWRVPVIVIWARVVFGALSLPIA